MSEIWDNYLEDLQKSRSAMTHPTTPDSRESELRDVAHAIRRGRFRRNGRDAVYDPDALSEHDLDDAENAISAMGRVSTPLTPSTAAIELCAEFVWGWEEMIEGRAELVQALRELKANAPITPSDEMVAKAISQICDVFGYDREVLSVRDIVALEAALNLMGGK